MNHGRYDFQLLGKTFVALFRIECAMIYNIYL